MTAPLEIVVTNAGRAAIVNAQNTGTAPVTITQVGISSTAVTPLPTAVALPGELKRVATIAGEVVADDAIHVRLTDDSADAYTLRSIGLYLADGTLFAIYGQAGPVLEKTAQSIASLAIDVIFADIAAASLTFGDATFSNPPATTERQGVVELATLAEAQAGIDALRALTPATAKAAILGWLLLQDGSGSGLDSDLLDGQHGSWYADIVGRLGYTPARTGSLGNVDLNTAVTGGIFRFETPTNGPAGLAFGQLLVLRGGADTITQIVSDYSSGALWTRSGNPAVIGGSGVWGTWRALVSAAGASTYSAADVLAKLLTVDGSGSGLDADLLDGQNGSWYADILARLGFTPLNKAGDTVQGTMAFANDGAFAAWKQGGNPTFQLGNGYYVTYEVANSRLVVVAGNQGRMYIPLTGNLDFYGTSGFYFNGQQLMHHGNDGAGSGYDADMVDGWHRDSIRDWNNLLNKPWNWNGQPGQPSWLWGGNANNEFYVYNPSNFSVNYANSAGWAGAAGTADKLSTAGGSAPSYAARAWVVLTGTGAVSIRNSGNVSSVADLGVGNYQINFATPLPTSNYATPSSATNSESVPNDHMSCPYGHTTTSVKVRCAVGNNAATDATTLSLAAFC